MTDAMSQWQAAQGQRFRLRLWVLAHLLHRREECEEPFLKVEIADLAKECRIGFETCAGCLGDIAKNLTVENRGRKRFMKMVVQLEPEFFKPFWRISKLSVKDVSACLHGLLMGNECKDYWPIVTERAKERKSVSEDKYEFFYGGPFSQWLDCDFTVEGVRYGCAEQYMMHQKALFFEDAESARKIMAARHPREQKALGRKVKGFDKEKWEAVARDIVYKGNYEKFRQNKGLLYALKETVGKELVEASPTDRIWGIGLAEDDDLRLDPANWRGTNWLGEVLMKVRDDLVAGVERTEDFGWTEAPES